MTDPGGTEPEPLIVPEGGAPDVQPDAGPLVAPPPWAREASPSAPVRPPGPPGAGAPWVNRPTAPPSTTPPAAPGAPSPGAAAPYASPSTFRPGLAGGPLAGPAPGGPTAPGGPPPGWYDTGQGVVAWWDGARWHPQAPVAAAVPFRSLGATSVLTYAGLACSVGVSLLRIANDLHRRALVDDYLSGTASFGDLTAADDTASTLAALGLVALLVTALAFLVWRYRVQANLEQTFGFRRLEFTPGWAVGWWFVPIANLWKPKQAMNEAWVASDPSARPSAPLTARPSALLSAWWAAWLIAAGISRVASVLGRGDDASPDDVQLAMSWSVAASTAIIVAAVLLIPVVAGITQRQRQRAAALGVAAR